MVVENSYYDHEVHGQVKVVEVEGDVVFFEKTSETVRYGGTEMPAGGTENKEAFEEQTKPSDFEAGADSTSLFGESKSA